MKIIESNGYNIEIGPLSESGFASLLREKYAFSKKIIFVDENTHDHCLEYLLTHFEELEEAEIMLLPAGEENKVMEVCFQVWDALSEYKVSRKDLVINLGGGVVTDMGGFIASIFKRGIDFINIPTSLLAMVDASVGGKTGIDLGRFKNQLGVFSNPAALFIDELFLTTLSDEEKQNGMAEMLKHGLIKSKSHWDNLKKLSLEEINLDLIYDSVQIKNQVVLTDPKEKNERKKLNFGHTFGHAFEGFLLSGEQKIAHGHAVALGMICESFTSFHKKKLNETDFLEIIEVLKSKFKLVKFDETTFDELFDLMLQDKKNSRQKINCVLLDSIGNACVDQEISREDFSLSVHYLNSLS